MPGLPPAVEEMHEQTELEDEQGCFMFPFGCLLGYLVANVGDLVLYLQMPCLLREGTYASQVSL